MFSSNDLCKLLSNDRIDKKQEVDGYAEINQIPSLSYVITRFYEGRYLF